MSHSLSRIAAVLLIALVPSAAAATSLVAVSRGAGFAPASSSGYGVFALVTVGLLLASSGLILYVRQPTRTSWALLSVVATAWFIAEWDSPGTDSAWVFSTGLALHALAPAVVCQLALAFPVVRPPRPALVTLVAAGYVVSVVLLGIVPALTYAPQRAGCPSCAQNLWLIRDDPALSAHRTGVGLACTMLWCAAAVGLLGWRLVRSSPARRRLTGLVQLAAFAYLLLVAAAYAHGLSDGYPGSDTTFEALWLGQAGALALLGLAIPVGLVMDRRAYRAMAQLSLALGSTRGGLVRSLGTRFRDPGLTIVYPDDDHHIDANGAPVDLRAVAADRVATPLVRDGTPVATIVHRQGILDSPYAVADLVSATHLALENERLHAIALAQLADLHSTGRRLVTAGDEARSLLERDLHDGAQQRLIGITLGLRMLRSMTPHGSTDLDAAEGEMRAAIDDLRVLARGLYPAVLRESGFRAALIALSERRLVRVRDVPQIRFPEAVEATAYLLVLRSSGGGPITVAAAVANSTLVVTVVLDEGGEPPALGEVRDRAIALDGNLAQATTEAGTRVLLTLPIVPGHDPTSDTPAASSSRRGG